MEQNKKDNMVLPLVSIIVPCYNQGVYLSETLDSVLAQTYINWECIIVDDGSPDNTEEIAKDYCSKDGRVKYLKQKNQGLAMSRNNGIKASLGKYILPLDSDDKIGSTYIEKAVSYLENNDSCKLVYCKAEFFGDRTGLWQLEEYSYDKLIWENCIFCSAMYRRSDYDKTAGYNPNMKVGLEDWDFLLSLLSPEDRVHRIDEVLFYYRKKSSGSMIDVVYRNNPEETYRQIYKNHSELYAEYVADIISLHNCLCKKNKEINNLVHSNSYKVGKIITFPVRLLKRLFARGA